MTRGPTRGPTRVIKLGGRVQREPHLSGALAAAWRAHPRALCVVHGGGDEVTAVQRRLGHEPTFRGGRRVTTPEDIEVLRMVLSGAANKRLVAALVGQGVDAVGLSGEDATLIAAHHTADHTLGAVGTPVSINVALLRYLLAGGYLPVLSPLARHTPRLTTMDERPGTDTLDVALDVALNLNGDDAAAAIAAALSADELLLVADVPGVLVDGQPRQTLDADAARDLLQHGAAGGGMAAKLEAALDALRRGVARVRIGGLAAITDLTCGTTITPVTPVTPVTPIGRRARASTSRAET